MQEDAGIAHHHVRTKPGGVRLDERDTHAVAVDDTHVHRSAVGVTVAPRHGLVWIDPGAALGQHVEIQQRPRLGMFVEDVGSVICRGPRRLDQKVCEQWVVGMVGQVKPSGNTGTRQRQVPLRVWRCRPQGVAPRVERRGLHPVSVIHRQVGFGVFAGAGINQRFTELAAIPTVAALSHQRPQIPSDSRSYYLVTRIEVGELRVASHIRHDSA